MENPQPNNPSFSTFHIPCDCGAVCITDKRECVCNCGRVLNIEAWGSEPETIR